VASVNGVRLDRNSMLACALGTPTRAFGPACSRFEKYERSPRLPAPPYLFMSRITGLEGEFGVERAGTAVDAEFDLVPREWYFAGDGERSMAFAALVEAGLQPCGWISCFTGIPLRAKSELYFRNLDGDAIIHSAVPERPGVLKTRALLTGISRSGPVTLTAFQVTISLNGKLVLEMKTGFGFFRGDDLAHQAGLPPSQPEISQAESIPQLAIDLNERPARFFAGALRLPDNDLLMIDRITGIGPAGIRAEKRVLPSGWFFKAHFYTDPVQPGSLGIEAILQTAQCFAIHAGLDAGVENARIQCVGPITWKYRGQVLPFNRGIRTDVRILAVRRSMESVEMDCEGWLWTDGSRIYHLPRFTLRIASK
jgi:3-hydroxymyristoyl/3-hydroxydecanoyl-(acyl carrier protein) dehydratase